MFCFIWKVCDVCVMLMVSPNVPTLHVLQRLSPHLWKPFCVLLVCCVLCAKDTWIALPRAVLNTRPHCSQVFVFLSVSMFSGVGMMLVLSGNHTYMSTQDDRVIFSTTYNPIAPDLKQKLKELQPVLATSERCKLIFPKPPLLAYRRNRNLNDMLVSRRLPDNTNIIPTPENIETDKNTNTCEQYGREFSTARGMASRW